MKPCVGRCRRGRVPESSQASACWGEYNRRWVMHSLWFSFVCISCALQWTKYLQYNLLQRLDVMTNSYSTILEMDVTQHRNISLLSVGYWLRPWWLGPPLRGLQKPDCFPIAFSLPSQLLLLCLNLCRVPLYLLLFAPILLNKVWALLQNGETSLHLVYEAQCFWHIPEFYLEDMKECEMPTSWPICLCEMIGRVRRKRGSRQVFH